jgi:cyanophycinase-like exopeptidase
MVKVHRDLIAGAPPGDLTMLDTPFGFQANADDLTDKIGDYFRDSVGADVDVASWRRRDEPTTARERALARIGRSSWAFAGPGSPSYALRQWAETPVPAALTEIVQRGGTLVMGSAAAVTLGSHSLPVYEIYKVGEESRWLPGLDLLGGLTGLRAAVIPHYDNREGGRHDTRFCYMGETRLLELEAMLTDDVGVLGVDEHTAVIIDLDTGRAEVRGNGAMTLRHRQSESIVGAGENIAIDDMRHALLGRSSAASSAPSAPVEPSTETHSPAREAAPVGLRATAMARRAAFDRAIAARDADGALEEALGLEQDIHDWSQDTLQSDDIDMARATLRSMIVDFGTVAQGGLRDESEVIGPFVDLALTLRQRAREAKDFSTSDAVRDGLVALGIDVRDTPEGATWERSGG